MEQSFFVEITNWLFGAPPTPQERVRAEVQQLKESVREIQAAERQMQRDQAKLVNELKRLARQSGSTNIIKLKAQQLVRLRACQEKLVGFETQLQTAQMNVQTVAVQMTICNAMGRVTVAMQRANRAVSLPKTQAMILHFQREMEKSKLQGEMIEEEMDTAFELEDEEGDIDDLVDAVLTEHGIELGARLPAPPSTEDPQLEARYANLRATD